jgi:K+-transporting ATPase ATPase A chain
MVGRTPEYLGKKIQSWEVKLAATLVLVMPMLVLILTAIAVSIHAGRAGPENGGPHGFTEILYGFTSPVNNNGSAFAGLTANTPFYNVMQSGAFWFGRFAEMVPALALGGVLAQKNVVAESAGTFRTDTPLFVGLFVGVILIVGALTFFPAVALGPIVEQLQSHKIYPTPSGIGPIAHHLSSNLRLLIGPKGSMS